MIIRKYDSLDNQQIVRLFFDTVHSVNKKDYNEAQRSVWAPKDIDIEKWCKRFKESYTVVVEENGKIIGFGNLNLTGYLDCLYVHKDHQRKGVACKIACALERYACENGITEIKSDVSITAKSFFIKQGYTVISENIVEQRGEKLLNYTMKKAL